MNAVELVKTLLNQKTFTQQQLASCLNVDQSTISKWKNGDRNMTVDQFEAVCGLYGYSLIDYLNGVEYQPISFSFSATKLEDSDIKQIGLLNNLFAQLKLMETLNSNESAE